VNTLLTYDVNKKHTEVKKAMKAKGYLDFWTSKAVVYYLPETTVWRNDISSAKTALADIKAVAIKLGVSLERAVAINWSPSDWEAIPGIPHDE
jgi:hypothetical protein